MAKKALEQSLAQISLARTTVDRYSSLMRDTKRWWPLLIPFLLWRGKKAYNKELVKALEEGAAAASRAAAEAQAAAEKTARVAEEAQAAAEKTAKDAGEGKRGNKQASKKGD